MKKEPEVPPPAVSGDIYEPEPEASPGRCVFIYGDDRKVESLGGSDRDERRLVAWTVRLVMRLPRLARWGLLAAALAGAGEFCGLSDTVLNAFLSPDPVDVRQTDRSWRQDLRLERADGEALHGR